MTPLFYFGNISYWIYLIQHPEIEFSLRTQIPKKSYANRCIISTANGLQTLSVPIGGGRGTRRTFKDIEISYAENWVAKHKMTIQSAYSKSPFYEHYRSKYEDVLDRKYRFLYELNIELTRTNYQIFKLSNLPINLNDESTDKLNFEQFSPNTFREISPYPQVFRNKFEFQSDLCILDLVFNLGNKAREYLNQ